MSILFSENFNGNAGSPLFSTNGTFNASGFAPAPTSGQLDSDFWRIAGFSDNSGLLNYGGTVASGTDYGRGLYSAQTTEGVYQAATGISALGASSFIVKPSETEFGTTPGTITLRIQYTGVSTLTSFTVDYDAVFGNSQGRDSVASLSWAVSSSAAEPSSFSPAIPALSFTTPVAADALGWQRSDLAAQTFAQTINANDYIFVRWSIGDNGGGTGARDEIGFDNIVVSGNTNPLISISPTSLSQNEGNAGSTAFTHTVTRTDTSADTSVQVTITGGTGFDAADIASVTVDGMPVAGFTLGIAFAVNFTGAQLSSSVVVNVAGDTTTEANESFTITLSSPVAGYALGTSVASNTVTNDDVAIPTVTHQIAEIQGTSHISPFVTGANIASSSIVTIEGIVTGRSNNGFYIQDDTPDTNKLTSDAIFVFTSTAPTAAITIGERVVVTGKVFEAQTFNNLPLTQIVGTTSAGATAAAVPLSSIFQYNDVNALPSIRIGGAGGLTPALSATNSDDFNGGLTNSFNLDGSGNPVDGTDFWETVEGMRVIYSDPVVSDGDWFTFNGLYVHSESIAGSGSNSRGGITATGGASYDPAAGVAGGGRTVIDGDQNPERIQLDFSNTALSTSGFGTLNTEIDMGDRLNDVTGIVRMDFTNWKLFVTETPTFKAGGNQATGPAPEVTTLTADSRQLKVAAYNVENLSLFNDNTQSQANFDAGIQKFNNIAKMLKENAGSPDVLLLSGVRDNNGTTNDGVTDASINWTALTQALRNETGRDYVWVDQAPVNNTEGGSGINLRVGMIYDRAKIQLGDGTFSDPAWTSYDGTTAADLVNAAASNLAAAASRRVWTDRIGDGLRDSGDQISISDDLLGAEIVTADWGTTPRTLLGEFTFNGQQLFLSANQWPSQGGSGAQYSFNPADLTADGLNARWQERKSVAQDMWSLAEYARTHAPEAKFVVGGALNDYWFFDPLRVLEGRIDATGAARASGLATLVNMNSTQTAAERFGSTVLGNSQTLDHLVVSSVLAPVTTYDAVHVNTGYNSVRVEPAARTFNLSNHDPLLIVTDFRSFAERLVAGSGGGLIDGFGGDDTLIGGIGNDYLIGGAGVDQMTGGMGNDTYDVDAAGDTVTEAANEGTDRVASSINWTLADHFENLLLTGNAAINGTGNGVANILIGNGASNTLTGGGGNDVLRGGAGNDTLDGGEGRDDLNGGLGADAMSGGGGDDLYYVDALGDSVSESSGQGADRVFSTVDWTLSDHVETLTLLGVSGIAGTGNSANNTITGNGAANALSGAGGADTLNAAAGDDTLTGGAGNDVLRGGAGADRFVFALDSIDLVADFVSGLDKIVVSAAGFGGGLAENGAVALIANGAPVALGTGGQFLYDTDDGRLWFDADGFGGSAAIQFARLGGRPAILAGDFLVLA
jgi:hypothetical protein